MSTLETDDCILEAVDCALQARADLGVDICKVSIVKRYWDEGEVGLGISRDYEYPVEPNPSIREFNHDIRLNDGGAIKKGDILVKGISRLRYTEESEIDGSVENPGDEIFYKVCDKLYNVVSVSKKIGTWEVMVRRLSAQEEYSV